MNPTIYDAVVIGAGPAGSSCAVWLSHLGYHPVVIERAASIGGLSALNPFQDAWNVTAPDLTGEEVSLQMKRSLESARVPVLLRQSVSKIETPTLSESPEENQPFFKIFFGEANMLLARKVVIASGVTPRRPEGLGDDPSPHILLGPGKHVYQYDFLTKRVAVLGGGDNAFENAIFAMDRGAESVHIYARSIRAQRKWTKLITAKDVHIGQYDFDPEEMTVNGLPYDTVMVFYGWQPQLDGVLDLQLEQIEHGYIKTDPKTTETSVAGIYAIGEVANRMHPCVVTSMADGVVAAKSIEYALDNARV